MRRYGARSLTVTATAALGNTPLIGGPVRLCGWSMNDGVASGNSQVDQAAAAPAAGATIASIALNNGIYQVQWTVELIGAAAAADQDNVELDIGATRLAQSVNPGVIGNYQQEPVQAQVIFGPLTLAAKAIGAASAGSTYRVQVVITPINDSTATIFDGAQPIGFVDIDPGGADTHWFTDGGIAVQTKLSVQTTLGTIQGVLWYEMVYSEHG